MLIADAEVEGRTPVSVRISETRVEQIETGLTPRPGEIVIEAEGGALLPGLHDHHIHLFALAAAQASVRCGPPDVTDTGELARVLRTRSEAELEGDEERLREDWIRGVGYHESVAGSLDRNDLDQWVADRPLRIQHRTGALWMLNSCAIENLRLDGDASAPGIERDEHGRATGRLFDSDAWLRERLGSARLPDLTPVGRQLAGFGVTGVTDATPTNREAEIRAFGSSVACGALRQRVLAMGDAGLAPQPGPDLTVGCVKVMLAERSLPDFDKLCERFESAHAEGRCVAVHCVTRTELVLATAAFRTAGVQYGDRIEHASVAPPDLVELVADSPLTIVTQPGFLYERGDAYAVDVEPRDRDWLYRGRGWLAAGVPLGGGTDAPYASADPWNAMRAAVDRLSRSGRRFSQSESLRPEQALALFTTPADAPGGVPRQVAVGAAPDLCLLDRPWQRARESLRCAHVVATIRSGRTTYLRDEI